MTAELLHEEEEEETVNGDSGYVSADKRDNAIVCNNRKNPLSDQPSSKSNQKVEQERPIQGKEAGTRKIVCPL